MQTISSNKNIFVKKLIQLSSSSKARRKQGLTIVEGIHLTSEYLKKVGSPEYCILASDIDNSEINDIVLECQKRKVKIITIEQNIYTKISPVVTSAGIMFVIKNTNSAVDINYEIGTVILDGVQDAGNLGTILRSAVATGVKQIICSQNTVSAWSPKVLRAGMGAHYSLNIIENQNLTDIVPNFKVPIFTTSLKATNSIYQTNLSGEVVWIFGNEGQGVSKEIQALVTNHIIIPQSSNIESLNVAMAATICMFEKMRQSL